jgi:hypothetical protein
LVVPLDLAVDAQDLTDLTNLPNPLDVLPDKPGDLAGPVAEGRAR